LRVETKGFEVWIFDVWGFGVWRFDGWGFDGWGFDGWGVGLTLSVEPCWSARLTSVVAASSADVTDDITCFVFQVSVSGLGFGV